MANVGDKYIIEIAERIACDESHEGDLYRIKGFNTLIFDDYGLGKLEKAVDATSKGLDLPEASDEIPVPEFMTEMKKEVDKLWDSWTVLKGKLCQAERRIERLEK